MRKYSLALLLTTALFSTLYTTLPPALDAYGEDSQRLHEQQREIDQLERRAYETREANRAYAEQQRQYQQRRDEHDRWERQEDQRRQSRGDAFEQKPNLGRWP